MKKRTIALMMAVVMLFGVAIGGTIAWLTSKTDPVVNTFTVGDVEIKLNESVVTENGTTQGNAYQLIPGQTYKKDPVVSVDRTKTNVDIYLFVKFEEVENPATYLTYTSTLTTANGWTQGDGTKIPSNVWYRTVAKNETTISWKLLAGDTVTVKDTVTKGNMADAAKAQLKWTAYAVQKDNFTTAEAAWDATFGAPTP